MIDVLPSSFTDFAGEVRQGLWLGNGCVRC